MDCVLAHFNQYVRCDRGTGRAVRLALVGTARCAVRDALSGASVPSGYSRTGTSQRDVPTILRIRRRKTAAPLRAVYPSIPGRHTWRLIDPQSGTDEAVPSSDRNHLC
jgi:hypothetical protein